VHSRNRSPNRFGSAIVRDGRLLLDCRTLGDDELEAVIGAAHASRA
jgi:hypothetical protein